MKYNEIRAKLDEMDEKERQKFILTLRKDCICHTCPTYNTCTRKSRELLYCFTDSSDCPVHKRKCLCPLECPIYGRFNLNNSFYCSLNKEIKDHLVYNKQVYRV
ncbi:MAG: DUF2769 domain-containing protein [Methanobacterium sp.]